MGIHAKTRLSFIHVDLLNIPQVAGIVIARHIQRLFQLEKTISSISYMTTSITDMDKVLSSGDPVHHHRHPCHVSPVHTSTDTVSSHVARNIEIESTINMTGRCTCVTGRSSRSGSEQSDDSDKDSLPGHDLSQHLPQHTACPKCRGCVLDEDIDCSIKKRHTNHNKKQDHTPGASGDWYGFNMGNSKIFSL